MKKGYILALFIVIADQITKYFIKESLQLYQSIELIPGFFNLTLAHNYGAAWSILSDQSGWQRWFLSIISFVASVFIIVWISRLKNERLLLIALSLVLGGAFGNFIDRAFYGYVVDFLHLYYENWHYPIFNVADSAITIGAVLLIIDSILDVRKQKK